jgi:capsid assembly protease
MKYSRIVAEFYSRIWAIREETFFAMEDLLRHQSAGMKWSPDEIHERIAAANAASGYMGHDGEAHFACLDAAGLEQEIEMQARTGQRNAAPAGSVAVIPMIGMITHRMSLMSQVSGGGGGSTEALTAQFRQALGDTNCKAIVFDVDSPGGSVEGVIELASEIYGARKTKPIVAVVNSMAASAAYWLASAAGEVVCTPSGQCGSIGVFAKLPDISEALKSEGITVNLIKAGKYKAEGDPSQPLSDEARAFWQSQVDSMYSSFVKAVAQQRGTSQTAVRDGYGEGRCLLATDALKAGLADRTGTLDDVLAKYGVKKASASRQPIAASASAAAEPTVLSGKVKSDGDGGDPDDMCGCDCNACKARTGPGGTKADDMGCNCTCNACQALENRAGAALTTPALTAEEERLKEEAAAGAALSASRNARRRRELHLL